MSDDVILSIEGAIERPLRLSFSRLAACEPSHQVADVSRFDPRRKGDAVSLAGLLELVGVRPEAAWLTLHASRDDFHASIPLADVRPHGLLVYRLDGRPLPESAGGPIRFLILESAACHTTDIDECANVKFVDRIELSRERGHDNRPAEERAHAELHRRQAEQARQARG